jgi:thiamine biosynthesis lipoprotein ApbE
MAQAAGKLSRRQFGAFALAFSLAGRARAADAPGVFAFGHDHVLGTSLDLLVAAPDRTLAEACESAVLEEVERLRRILSTYDPASEIGRLNATSAALRVSPELLEVLDLYESWRLRTAGAFNGRLGSILALWKEAEASGREPDDALLAAAAREIDGPAVELDVEAGTARRLGTARLNVDALGKNYILAKALRAARTRVPAATGLLLSIGGDVVSWGAGPDGPWIVGVMDPRTPFENAPPAARTRLRGGALTSSGSYERFFTVAGRRIPRMIDPRTGRPATGVLGASVLAPDPVTADALSTTLCVLPPEEGLRLIASIPDADAFLVAADGAVHTSPGWARRTEPVEISQQKNTGWPAGYQVTIDLALAKSPKASAGKPYRRPYVAVWIEDPSGRPVRTVAVWGNDPKYLKELTLWWTIGSKDAALVKAVSKATRDGGAYKLSWDGLDDKGQPVPQGVYVVRLEVHREFGQHIKNMSAALPCRAKPSGLDFRPSLEVDGVKVRYGPVAP